MPDFSKLLESTKQENEDIQNGLSPEDQNTENQQTAPPTEAQQTLSDFYQGEGNSSQSKHQPNTNPENLQQSGQAAANPEATSNDIYSQATYGGYSDMNDAVYVDPESWSADEVYKDFFSRSGENIMFGLGTMIGSYGDLAQAVGGLATGDWEGNAVSRVLQEAGEDLEQQWTGYVPKEMLDPKFKVSTFMDPNFWSIHGARFVPQLLEILATYGMASGAKKGAQYGAKKLLKGRLDDLGKVTTKGKYLGSEAVQEVATGKGWISKVMTDQGTFTKKFGNLFETVAAGSLTNLRVSLSNAGEMYNTYAELKDDNGQPIFNEQELGEMASGAFSNNMAYIGMDILSWGMTFGRGGGLLKNFGMNSSKIGAKATSNISKLYARNVSPLLRKASRFGAKMTKEGMEEQVQESFEEWSKIEAYRDKFGTIEGYQGKLTKEYKRGGLLSSGFLDYLQSSDSEGIRTIAFGVGAMAGGAFNVKTLFNKEADGARNMINRTENLKTQFEDGTEGKKYQRKHIYSQIAELVYDGKGEAFVGFIKGLNENEIVSDQEMDHYESVYDKMAEANDEIEMMDVMGKKAFMNNIVEEAYYMESLDIENQASERRIESYKKNIKTPEVLANKIQQEEKNLALTIKGIKYKLAQIQQNKENLLTGKKAKDIDEGVTPSNENGDVTADNIEVPKSIGEKILGFMSSIKEKVFSNKESEPEFDMDTEEGRQAFKEFAEQEQNIEVKNPQEYISKAAIGDNILVDGNEANITSINNNANDETDNLDYELADGTKGNVRVTKENTFNDDRANKKTTLHQVVKPKLKPQIKQTPDQAAEGTGRQSIDESNRKYDYNSNPNVYTDTSAVKVTPEIFEEFKKTGQIPSGILSSIAFKIVSDPSNVNLTNEEKQIFKAEEDTISDIVGRYLLEQDIQQKMDKEDNQDVKNYTEEDSERDARNVDLPKEKQARQIFDENKKKVYDKAKEKLNQAQDKLNELQEKAKEVLNDDEKATVKKQITNAKRQVTRLSKKVNTIIPTKKISEEVKKGANKVWDSATNFGKKLYDKFNDSLDDVENMTYEEIEAERKKNSNNTSENVKRKWEQAKQFADKAYRTTYSALRVGNGYMNSRTANPANGWFDTAEIMTVNEKIGQMFPDVMPRVYTLDNLYKGIGVQGVGYALASTIFIQENKWNQGKVFMHELSHIYFALTKEDPTTQSLLRLAMQDKALVADIKSKYDHDIYYRTKISEGNKFEGAATKQELLGPDYQSMTKVQRDSEIESLLIQGKIEEIPDSQQPIISEEVFVAKLEGDLNSTYTKLFDKKNDFKRQFYAKKWWGNLKKRANDVKEKFAPGEASFLKTLSKRDSDEYTNSKEYILDKFSQVTKGTDVSATGREARIKADKATKAIDLINISKRRIENQEQFIGKPLEQSNYDREVIKQQLENPEEDMEVLIEQYDGDLTFQKHALKFTQKANKTIRQFNQAYGLALTKRFYRQNRGKKINWSETPVYDGDLLRVKLFDLAHESISADEFIYNIESLDIEEVYAFNNFLDHTREDKETFLASLWHLNRNTEFINGVKLFVSKTGEVKIESGMNFREQTQFEQTKTNAIKYVGAYFKGGKKKGSVIPFDKYKTAADNIRTGNYTDYDIAEVLNFFSGPKTDIARIMQKGVLNLKGKQYTVDELVYAMVMSPKALGGSNPDSLYVKGGGLKVPVRDFIQAIIVSNRPYTAEYTVLDANNNLKPSQQINNALLSGVRKMNNDALEMSLPVFLKKYAQSTKNLRKGELRSKPENALLTKIYEDAQKGKSVTLNTYDGVQNQQNNNSSTLKNSNAIEQSFNEITMFLASEQEYGKDSGNYLMDLGRFSDSPRAFLMEVPKHKFREILDVQGNQIVIKKHNPKFKAAFKIAKDSGYTGNFNSFAVALENDIKEEIRFINENNDINAKLSTFDNFISNGRVTPQGQAKIAEYVVNQSLNQLFFKEVFLPSYKNDEAAGKHDVVKRAKSVTSPFFKLGDWVKIEAIPLVDSSSDVSEELDDGAMYMLASDIKRVAALGGNAMPLGHGIKGVNAGVEYDNKNFAGNNTYHKGYIFPLTEEYVKKHPNLKGVYDMLMARSKVYTDRNGGREQDLSKNIETHLPYAYHLSADKSKSYTQQQFSDIEANFTLENLNNGDLTSANNYLDNVYYDQGNKNFLGLSGDNFGVQQVMDKKTDQSIMSVQLTRALGANAGINGTVETAEELQGQLTELMQDNLREIEEVLNSNDPVAIRKLIKDGMNIAEMDPIQAMSIQNDKLSFNTPELRVIARNQLANIVRMKGNKLKTPGAVLQQRPSHYKNPHGNTNGSDGLSFYTKVSEKEKADAEKYNTVEGIGGNGKPFKTVQTRNNIKTTTRKGEAVVSSNLTGKVQPRKYFTFKNVRDWDMANKYPNVGNREQQLLLMRDAAFDVALNNNKNVGIVYGSNKQVVGFYVEGDSIMATRIPAHGPQTTGVFEVIDFDELESSNIELPPEFALGTTGGDFDGDQIFLQHRYPKHGKGSKHQNKKGWNSFMDKFETYWLSDDMQTELRKEINHVKAAKAAKVEVEKQFPGRGNKTSVIGTPAQRRKDFANTLSTADSIGIVANAHALIGMLSTYSTPLKKRITINGATNDTFQDIAGSSRTIESANLFQIVLDNAKDQTAEILGINRETAVIATILTNLNYSLDEIALILNTDVVKKFVEIKSNKENVYNTENTSRILAKTRSELKIGKTLSSDSMNINTGDIHNPSNAKAILNLLESTEAINEDLMKINGIMSQHNSIEISPFELRQQKKDFISVLNNENNSGLTIPEGFKNNPLVENYKNTVNVIQGYQEKIDPVYRKKSAELYEDIVEGSPFTLTKVQKQHLYNLVELFHTARSMGYNNIDKAHLENLTKAKHSDNIFDRLEAYKQKLATTLIRYDKNNPQNNLSQLEHSLLFSKLINYHGKGNNQFISLNTGYFKENISDELRQRAIDEFQQIPPDLKNDLILYDLMTNGFKSGKSLFPIFSRDFREIVSISADDDIKTKDIKSIPNPVFQQLLQNILSENAGTFADQSRGSKKPNAKMFIQVNGKWEIKLSEIGKFPKIKKRLVDGKPFYFKQNNDVWYFKGFNESQTAQLHAVKNLKDKAELAAKMAPNNFAKFAIKDSDNNEGIIAIKDTNQNPYYDWEKKDDTRSWKQQMEQSAASKGRQAIDNSVSSYYQHESEMSRQAFDGLQNYDITVEENQKETNYRSYLDAKKEADEVYNAEDLDNVLKKKEGELNDLYQKYGVRHKFAYAKVLNAITHELTQRSMQKQVMFLNKKSPGYSGNQNPRKDITPIQKLLMSNNIPSNQPAVQGTVRTLENSYKTYQKERVKYIQKINNVTNALYMEKYNYKPSDGSIIDKIKTIIAALVNLTNREGFYKKLYGNLMIVSEGNDPVTGKQLQKIKYKPKAQIEEEYNQGSITKAEYDFYKTTTEISEELKPFVVKEGRSRTDYVPHVAPDLMEKFSRRGLLGLLVHGRSVNEQIYEVNMNFINPITNKREEGVKFKYIEDIYNALSTDTKTKAKHSLDFVKLKRRANAFYKAGKNEDGSPIRYSKVTVGSAIGDVFMNDFAGSNNTKAQNLPSFDLNKAFTDYVDSTLYTFGNDNFTGMKKMLPLIDGLLVNANRDGNKQLEEYIDKTWRQYFLSGQRQKIKYNSNTLLALGVTSDDVINFITKGSLLYWLGYKGLAIGGGAYAIGNVLVGKYHNLKNAGGKAFAKGENRFWFGKEGKIDWRDPMKGLEESQTILKNLGFLDINIYDEVGIHKKNSLDTMLSGLALMPMIRSEKWIQGSHFLGLLTDAEWDHVKNGGELDNNRLNELEEEVKTSHGKGYQPTDQRMLQLYSWGRTILQFSRYLPTMVYDRMAPKDLNRYGNIHMGAYQAMWEPIQRMATGEMNIKDFQKYYRELEPQQKKRFNSGLIGFGMMASLLGIQQIGEGNKLADDLYWDANSMIDFNKLNRKLTPPSVSMLGKLTGF